MTKPKGQKADEHIRVYMIRPPHLDPKADFPATDCQRDDTAPLFFGPDYHEQRETDLEKRTREREARGVCAGCPFTTACALHGLEYEDYGIWGGMTEQDRSALGGRGVTSFRGGRRPGPEQVATRMIRAGISQRTVEAVFRGWGRRLRAIKKTKGDAA